MSMSKLQRTMSGDSKSLQDSGTGSFGSESDSSPVQPKLTSVNNGSCHNPVNGDKQLREQPASFQVGYLGGMALDKRHTQPMVPWMLTEMKRKKTPVQVNLSIAPSSLKATSEERELFEHNPLTISRFAKSNQHPACFGYLTRNSSGSPYTCHGFVALSEPTVQDIFQALQRASAASENMKDPPLSDSVTIDTSGAGALLFEVLYVGKVHVSSKKAPPTFIDEAVSKFLEYEVHKDETRPKSHSLSDGDFSTQRNLLKPGSNPTVTTSCESLMTTGRISPLDMTKSDVAAPIRQTVLTQAQRNRTMLLQIGRTDVCLISPDRKSIIFDRKFKDISFCSQGIQHPEHFGFISRSDSSSNSFVCYVFKCATEAVVEEVMQTLKQAFQTAFQNTAAPVCSAAVSSALNKSHVVCELCPMHQLHKLCLEIDKLAADKVHEILQSRVDQLCGADHREVLAKLKTDNPQTIQEVNECIMVTLRQMCEERQSTHVHLSDAPKGSTGKPEFFLSVACRQPPSMLDHLKQKAKKSLASSFDNLMRESSSTTSPTTSPPPSPVNPRGGSSSFSHGAHPQPPPRPRSSTVPNIADNSHLTNSQPGVHGKLKKSPTPSKKISEDTSPVRAMFMRVGQSSQVNFMQLLSPSSNDQPPAAPIQVSDSPIAVTPSKQTSWRLDILNRVVTPARRQETLDEADGPDHVKTKMTPQKVRALWRKAILETLLLIRMERENKTLQARLDEVETKRQKLDYEEITPCLKEVTKVWDKMLSDPQRPVAHINTDDINSALKKGVPRSRRGEIWQLCVEQHRLRHHAVVPMTDNQRSSYEDLLKQLTVHQHAILIDLGRTFPAHPYFSTALGPGQLALFNLLKAYSLLDKEVGYCQGLSFVAGILLMHMPEERAFQTMKYIMFQLGFRRQYRPDMIALQIQMYQLSRLLHDYHRDLDAHLQQHDIGPTLYAAPWFLTIFASQFPLGFVARVYDLIFQQGLEVVFKVALVLLGNHKELIKQCDSFEANVEFLKTTLPSMGIIQMERVINQVFQMDLSQKLQAYEVEYHVLQEEISRPPLPAAASSSLQMRTLEQANRQLQQQKIELLEQLQSSRSQTRSLESQLERLQTEQGKLNSHIRTLELERAALLNAVSRLQRLLPEKGIELSDVQIPLIQPNRTITNSPIHNPLVNPLIAQYIDEGKIKLMTNSLTELDREVASWMEGQRQNNAASSQGLSIVMPVKSTSGSGLNLPVQNGRERRPSSSNV